MRIHRTLGPARTRKKRRSLLAGPPAGADAWGRRLWWTARGVGLAAALLALAGGALWAWENAAALPALAVSEVRVEGNQVVREDEVRRLAGVSPGEPLLAVSLDRVRRGVLRHPWLREAEASRRLPGTLVVRVRERVPLALLAQGGAFALVDGEGTVLSAGAGGPGAGDRFPIVSGGVEVYRPGETAGEALPALRALAALLGPGGVSPDRVSEVTGTRDGRILVSLTGSGTVLVMGPDDPVGQANRLARLAAAGEFDQRAAGYDLRFTGRVVRLPDREQPKPKGGKAHGQG